MLTLKEYEKLADETLLAIEEKVEKWDINIDSGSSGNILTLIFQIGSKIIINKQPAMQEIYRFAAKCGGFHFKYRSDRQQWCSANDVELSQNYFPNHTVNRLQSLWN
ncbi:MAG: iron donor protein CyaY [Thiotrichaceae bacterium]